MTSLIGPVVLVVAVLAFWYWRYYRQVGAAGGRQKLAEQQMRQEFDLAEGEKVQAWWMGVCYIGPLQPGGGAPTLADRMVNALEKVDRRGAQVHFCLTDRGRIGVSMEPKDGMDRSAAIAKATFGSQQACFRPFALVAPGGARLLSFAEAFPGASYPADEAPRMTGAAGGQVACQLVNWWGSDQRGFSAWVDPAAAQRIREQLSRRAV